MKRFMVVAIILTLLMMAGGAAAEYDPCDPPPGIYRTQTQGGWGSNCAGNNPGCIRDNCWDSAFDAPGLIVGGYYTILFTSSQAVADFLATGGTPDVLTQDYIDPVGSTDAGIFAGQVTALALTLAFGDSCLSEFNISDLYWKSVFPSASDPFSGMTVRQLFNLANEVMGGNTGALPGGASVSDLSDVITHINENFVDGTQSNGYLVEEDCDEDLAVELTSFHAVAGNGRVTLNWQTASETDNDYFEILRDRVLVTTVISTNRSSGDSYQWIDDEAANGTSYTYSLTAVDINGTREFLDETEATPSFNQGMIDAYALHQNYPNPFNPSTTIAFDLAASASVSLKVYNLIGQQVAELINGPLNAGRHIVPFSAESLPSGVYLYRLEANGFAAQKKMLLMK